MATIVMLPGAGGDSWYWHAVAPGLRALGHDVVTVDLPFDDDTAGLSAYADKVVHAVGGRTGIVLVAQSMGAFTAVQVCERIPVALLVLVAPMIPAPGESPGSWWAATGQPQARRENDAREGRDPDAPFDAQTLFLHDLSPAMRARAFERPPRQESKTPFTSVWHASRWPEVPVRVLAGRYDRFFPLEFMRRLSRERLGVEPEVIDSGHLPALSRPEELVQRIDRYAAGA